jgi:serine/threonine-protein kinase
MFSGRGVLKVTDFGIAKVVGGAATVATRAGDVLGTPAYMAPEQAMGADLTPATDVYAVGTVLYQLLSGRLPFPEDTNPITMLYRHVHEEPEPLSKAAPRVPRQLADVTARAIERDPAVRYQDAESLAVGLAAAAADIWGPEWMTDTEMSISASGPVLQAATGRATINPTPAAPETIGPLPREVPMQQAGGTGDLVAVNMLDPSLGGPAAGSAPPAAPPPVSAGPPTMGPSDTVPTPETVAAGASGPMTPSASGPMTMDAPSVAAAQAAAAPPGPPVKSGGGGGKRALLIVVVLVVLVGAAVAATLVATKKKSPKPLVASVTVSGTKPFTDTGVDLKLGDNVTITATGKVRPSVTDPNVFASPDGVPNRPDLRQFNVIPNVNHSGMMGWITDNGAPFPVGSRKVFKAPKTGRLFLGINDKGVENNDGKFQATVTVTSK